MCMVISYRSAVIQAQILDSLLLVRRAYRTSSVRKSDSDIGYHEQSGCRRLNVVNSLLTASKTQVSLDRQLAMISNRPLGIGCREVGPNPRLEQESIAL